MKSIATQERNTVLLAHGLGVSSFEDSFELSCVLGVAYYVIRPIPRGYYTVEKKLHFFWGGGSDRLSSRSKNDLSFIVYTVVNWVVAVAPKQALLGWFEQTSSEVMLLFPWTSLVWGRLQYASKVRPTYATFLFFQTKPKHDRIRVRTNSDMTVRFSFCTRRLTAQLPKLYRVNTYRAGILTCTHVRRVTWRPTHE